MKRFGFRKSHHGCELCKRRKVKCDEIRPACGHCARRGEQCNYEVLAIRGSHGPSFNQSPAQSQSQPSTASDPSPGSLESPIGGAEDISAGVAYLSPTSLQDLKLLHVYVSNASHNFFDSKDSTIDVWHNAVPKIGFEFPFVLHGILAMAAFQCAYGEVTPPSKSPYHVIGTNHYAAALPLFRDAVRDITEANCTAVLAFSMLAPAIAFSLCSATSLESIENQDTRDDIIADVATIISLLKGIDLIIVSFRDTIASGPLGSVLRWEANPPAKALIGKDLRAIETLERIVQEYHTGRYNDGGVNVDYEALLHNIRESFLECGTNPGDRAVRVKWMMRVPPGFIEAVRGHDMMALAMLTALGVLLDRLREHWWCENTGRNIVAAVSIELETAAVSPDVRVLLQWALESTVRLS